MEWELLGPHPYPPALTTSVTSNSRHLHFSKRFYLFVFRERVTERQRERNINVGLPLACPLLGTWPETQACALTGNQTGDLLVCKVMPNALSRTSQGWHLHFFAQVFPAGLASWKCWSVDHPLPGRFQPPTCGSFCRNTPFLLPLVITLRHAWSTVSPRNPQWD